MDRKQEAQQLLSSGQADQAVAVLQEAVRENVNDGESYALLGIAMAMTGRNAEAIPYFERSLELEPNQASTHFNLGAVYERLGENTKATTCYQRALQLDPHYQRAAEALQRLTAAAPPTPPPTPEPTPMGPMTPPSPPPAAGNAMRPMAPPAPPPTGPTSPYSPPGPSVYTQRPSEIMPAKRPGVATMTGIVNIISSIICGFSVASFFVQGGTFEVPPDTQLPAGISPEEAQRLFASIGAFMLIIMFGLMLLYAWLAYASFKGSSAPAWYAQIVVFALGLCCSPMTVLLMAVLNLLGWPLGLLVNAVLLGFWFTRDNRAWFGT